MSSGELIQRQEQNYELTIPELAGRMDKLREAMRSVMREGEDYGAIPGAGTKKVLLQPGGEKLAMLFRFAASYDIERIDLPAGHREYSVTCKLTHIPTGSFVGSATANCSSMEPKYRYRSGSIGCPECGKNAIIKGKAEYGGGWVCFKKKGGCGAKFPDAQFSPAMLEKIENADIAAEFNTVCQMSQKRAFLRAIRMATASSELFTQDVDVPPPEDEHEPPGSHVPRPEDNPPRRTPPPAAAPPAERTTLQRLNDVLFNVGCRTADQANAVVWWATDGMISTVTEAREPDNCQQVLDMLNTKRDTCPVEKVLPTAADYRQSHPVPPIPAESPPDSQLQEQLIGAGASEDSEIIA